MLLHVAIEWKFSMEFNLDFVNTMEKLIPPITHILHETMAHILLFRLQEIISACSESKEKNRAIPC